MLLPTVFSMWKQGLKIKIFPLCLERTSKGKVCLFVGTMLTGLKSEIKERIFWVIFNIPIIKGMVKCDLVKYQLDRYTAPGGGHPLTDIVVHQVLSTSSSESSKGGGTYS